MAIIHRNTFILIKVINQGCNSSCLTFSPLKSHVVIDEICGAQKKCTQTIYDLCFWQFKRIHSVGNRTFVKFVIFA